MSRPFPTLGLWAFVLAGAGACTLGLRRERAQCATSADCQAFGPDYVCSTDEVCVRYTVDERPRDVTGDECRTDAECAGAAGPSLCRAGSCLPLEVPELGCVSLGWGTPVSDDGATVVPLGILVPATELTDDNLRLVSGAVGTAINELNHARGDDRALRALPPLVGVACDEESDPALAYLVNELEAPALIGPTRSDRVERVIERTRGRAVVFLPAADGPELESGGGGERTEYVIGCKPNRGPTRGYFLDAVAEVMRRVQLASELNPVPVLAVSEDVSTSRFAAGLDDRALAASGVQPLDYTLEPRGRDLVNALRSHVPPPNLIVAASSEDVWADNISAIDAAIFAEHGFYPYYFVMDKRYSLLSTVLDRETEAGFPRQYQRLLGLDHHRSRRSREAYAEFDRAFQDDPTAGRVGAPAPGLEYAYDCTYVAAFAALAAEQRRITQGPLHAEALMAAVDALTDGGPALSVGARSIGQVVEQLIARRGAPASVDLVGSSGELDFERGSPPDSLRVYLRPETPDGELYCISQGEVKEFCDTGVVFPAEGGPPSPDPGDCACPGAP